MRQGQHSTEQGLKVHQDKFFRRWSSGIVVSVAHDEGHEALTSSRSIGARRDRPALKP
jgi:hypothetical protein